MTKIVFGLLVLSAVIAIAVQAPLHDINEALQYSYEVKRLGNERREAHALSVPIREKGRCAATLLQPNQQNVPSPWNGLAFAAPANMPVCTEYQASNVCCSIEQVESIQSNVAKSASLIARCPSCLANFERFFCAMTCSPDQSLFITPLTLFNDSDPLSWVRSIGFAVYTPFAEAMYDSCKDIKFPSTGGSVMTVLGGSKNYTDFLGYLAYSSGLSPPLGALMDIKLSYETTSVDEITGAIPNTTVAGASPLSEPCSTSCSCTDCPGTCPVVPPPPVAPDTTVHIGKSRFELITFTVFVLGVICVLLILSIGFILFATKPKPLRKLQAYNASEAVSAEKSHAGLVTILNTYFRYHGRFVARKPWWIVAIAILFIGFSVCWVWRLKLLTKPEDLWVPPGSTSLNDKNRFDRTFGKFYRVEQAILQQKGDLKETVILTRNNMLSMLDAHNYLVNMNVTYKHDNGTEEIFDLSAVCFKPLLGKGCLVNSPLNYFQESRSKIISAFNPSGTFTIPGYIKYCSVSGQYSTFCMTSIGTPVDAQNVLGGYPGDDYTQSTALVFTFLLNNLGSDELNYKQLAWEDAYLKYWEETSLNDVFDIGYSTERSVQDELERESLGDIPGTVISFVLNFIYVALILGVFKRPFLLNSRILLALAGIFVVIFSIAISVGLCALFGVAATLIITGVIPFLVLAIGIDNIFIMVDSFSSLPKDMSIEERVGEMLSRVGVSITMAAFAEGAAFLLGMLTRMPAVTAFAVYACVAILFNWALQITFFVALIALDARRRESGRYDVLFCIRAAKYVEMDDHENENGEKSAHSLSSSTNGVVEMDSRSKSKLVSSQEKSSTSSHRSKFCCCYVKTRGIYATVGDGVDGDPIKRNGYLSWFFDRYYAPFLLHPITKIFVIALFLVLLLACIGLIPKLELGLPQDQAMPKNSYLVDYFEALAEVGRAGPPFYIVLEGPFNYTDRVMQNKLCSVDARVGGCERDSMDNTFYTNTRQEGSGFLANTTLSSWLDTYLIWLRPTTGCCNQFSNGTFCFLEEDTTMSSGCSACLRDSDFDEYGRPSEATFMKYFPTWLQTKCVTACGSCGSVFASEIQLDYSKPTTSSEFINTTRYRAYHKNLVNQSDFISALQDAYDFTDDLNDRLGLDSYPYSSYYIFFEQYQYVGNVAKLCIAVALAAIFVVTLILLSNLYASILITLIVGIIQVDLLGIMALWNVNLNAISVVNLVMSVGMSVEFCVHICHSFLMHNGTRQHRARLALVEVGSPVLQGITLSHVIPIVMLAFARSRIFQIYYFRMFTAIVVLAALHCLILLPVLLSLIGPRTRKGPFSLY
jgi:Niemann-Pick C1 protein